ncbi:MAG: hypothetical protein Q7S95_02885 [bacterium]|nr:hypothetical protein [bacterium]
MSLFNRIVKTLSEVGGKKFVSNHRDWESLAEFFFMVALKKYSGEDFWMLQPEDQFPDFDLMTASQDQKAISITLDRFELVTVPDRCNSFEDALNIVKGKISKGYPENYNLLVFVNHVRSREWVSMLNKQLADFYPFKSVWTVYLLFQSKDNHYSAVVNRIRPQPLQTIEANFSDKKIWEMDPLPIFMEEVEMSGKKCRAFKGDFMDEFNLKMRKATLERRKRSARGS